jgi:hypothetical protein
MIFVVDWNNHAFPRAALRTRADAEFATVQVQRLLCRKSGLQLHASIQESCTVRVLRARPKMPERHLPNSIWVRSCNLLISPLAPPEAMIEANSSRRVARSLIVPLK